MFAILKYFEFKCRRDPTFLISTSEWLRERNINNVVINS